MGYIYYSNILKKKVDLLCTLCDGRSSDEVGGFVVNHKNLISTSIITH